MLQCYPGWLTHIVAGACCNATVLSCFAGVVKCLAGVRHCATLVSQVTGVVAGACYSAVSQSVWWEPTAVLQYYSAKLNHNSASPS